MKCKAAPFTALGFIAFLILVLPVPVAAQSFLSSTGRFDRFPETVSIQPDHFAAIQGEAANRFPELPAEQVQSMTRTSFDSVYFEKVNRGRLLVEPDPDFIAERVIDILREFRALQDALQEGTDVIITKGNLQEQLKVVREIRDHSKQINGTFKGYFLETYNSSLTVSLPLASGNLEQFSLFLHEARALVRSLAEEINNYYFDSRPGVVAVSDFRKGESITVLTDVLIEISETLVDGARPG